MVLAELFGIHGPGLYQYGNSTLQVYLDGLASGGGIGTCMQAGIGEEVGRFSNTWNTHFGNWIWVGSSKDQDVECDCGNCAIELLEEEVEQCG